MEILKHQAAALTNVRSEAPLLMSKYIYRTASFIDRQIGKLFAYQEKRKRFRWVLYIVAIIFSTCIL
jgi:hypothetical protein